MGTFLRNRPKLELLIDLLDQRRDEATPDLTVLGWSKGAEVYTWSKGAEVYTMLYAMRCARPDLEIELYALDIDMDVLENSLC